MSSYSIDVDVLVNGKPIKQHAHDNRLYIEAKSGSEYSVKVKNNSWSRRLIVCSVDGINVIDGKAAGSSKAGYIVNGYSSIDIKGFRTSNNNVNVFKFNSKDKSYAALSEETKGDTRNCGVIGIEVYAEKEKPIPAAPLIIERIIEREKETPKYPWIVGQPWCGDTHITWTTMNNDSSAAPRTFTSSCGGSSSSAYNDTASLRCFNAAPNMNVNFCSVQHDVGQVVQDFDMGTEFSDKEITDAVREVEFETGLLLSTYEVFYASRTALLNMGIPLVKETQISLPKAFPNRFCKPPQK